MKRPVSIRVAYFVILFSTITLVNCSHTVIPVTDPNIAHLPVITINGFPDGGSIEKNNQTAQSTINADFGMGISISGSAYNPDGVKDFSIEIVRNGSTRLKVFTNSILDASGKVPDRLPILGTDKMGGTGNTPIKFIMDTVTEVKVNSNNFAGKSQSFTLFYVPVAASQRGKVIIQTVSLQKDFTLGIFAVKFPPSLANGTLIALNGGPFDVYLIKPTNGSPLNCNDPATTYRLQAFGNLSGNNDYISLFGSVNPPFPITLKACASGPAANSDHVDLQITYRLN